MGLRAEIQADLAQAFNTDLADAIQPFTGSRTVTAIGDYDPVTDTTTGDQVIKYTGRGVFTEYTIKEIDALTVLITDTKLIALQNEVNELPQVDDTVNGVFRVVNVGADPADASITVQLRKV